MVCAHTSTLIMNINRIVLLVLLIPPFYYIKTHLSKTRMTADGRQRLTGDLTGFVNAQLLTV